MKIELDGGNRWQLVNGPNGVTLVEVSIRFPRIEDKYGHSRISGQPVVSIRIKYPSGEVEEINDVELGSRIDFPELK